MENTTMANDETLLDLDNLDDIDVSTVETAPEFIEPATGRYKLKVSVKKEEGKEAEGEEDAKAARYRFVYSVVDVLQLKNKDDLVPATGSLFSESFSCTKQGLTYWKQRAEAILGKLGNAKIKEVNESLNAVEFFLADVHMEITEGKNKAGEKRTYKNVRVKVISEDAKKLSV